MKLINYDAKTGEVKFIIKDIIDVDEIGLLRSIKEDKEISFELLAVRREEEFDKTGTNAVDLINTIHNLQDLGLVKECPIYNNRDIAGMVFRLTNLGSSLLKIIDKEKETLL